MLRDVAVAPLHEGPDGGGGGVELRDAVAFDDVPKAVALGEVGGALVHQRGHAVGQQAVDDVAVAGDPAAVGGTPVDVDGGVGVGVDRAGGPGEVLVVSAGRVLVRGAARPVAVAGEVEGEPGGEVRPHHVAGGGVEDALGLAGAAGGVEEEERVFGVHLLGGAVGGLLADERRPVVVAAAIGLRAKGRGGVVRPLVDQHVGHDARALAQERLVHGRLERDDLAAAVRAVAGDQEAAVAVDDAVGDGRGREAAEDHRMNSADAGAGEHRDRQLRHHAHVDGHDVALLHAEAPQRVGAAGGLREQVGVAPGLDDGLAAGIKSLFLPHDRGLVAEAGVDLAVEAVHAQVGLGAAEPHRVGGVPAEHAVPLLVPEQVGGDLGPEAVGVVERALVQRLVLLHGRDVSVGREVGRRREGAVLLEHRLGVRGRRGGCGHGAERGGGVGARAASRGSETGCAAYRLPGGRPRTAGV